MNKLSIKQENLMISIFGVVFIAIAVSIIALFLRIAFYILTWK